MLRRSLLAFSLLSVSCAEREAVPWIDLMDLTPSEPTEDPFADERPQVISCEKYLGYFSEDDALEIDTNYCTYASLVTPTLLAAEKGDEVSFSLAYFDLTAPAPARAHVAVTVGETILWEQSVAIPGTADVIDVRMALPRDVPRGTSLGLHLHNHGQNTWNFSSFQLH